MTQEDRRREDDRTTAAVAAVEQELTTARAESEARGELLRACRDHIWAAGHLSPRCEYHGECRCDMDDLLQRIDDALGEEA